MTNRLLDHNLLVAGYMPSSLFRVLKINPYSIKFCMCIACVAFPRVAFYQMSSKS